MDRTDGARGLTVEDLRSVFRTPANRAEAIGLEVECAVLDPVTGRSTPYEGVDGIGAILRRLISVLDGAPVMSGEYLIGLRHDSGMQIALEHGGAIEYASAPHRDLASLMSDACFTLEAVGEVVRGFGRALVAGAMFPFTAGDDMAWMPKPYSQHMRAFFADLGERGSLGPTVMASTISTQVTLDYISEEDLRGKLAVQVAASPVAASIFANSPLEAGRLTGLLSYRTHCWQRTDPRRCGVLGFALEDPSPDAFIDWALQLPMIFRKRRDRYERAPSRPFAELLRTGFDDGTFPDRADWVSLLSQVWTDVRLRATLELRAADGPAYPDLAAVPAFWVGLTYDRQARDAAWELLRLHTASEYERAMPDVARNGLGARVGASSMLELGRELVALASAGLKARVEAGLEQAAVLGYLEPVEERLAAGRTPAEELGRRWTNDLARSPARYVEAYRIC